MEKLSKFQIGGGGGEIINEITKVAVFAGVSGVLAVAGDFVVGDGALSAMFTRVRSGAGVGQLAVVQGHLSNDSIASDQCTRLQADAIHFDLSHAADQSLKCPRLIIFQRDINKKLNTSHIFRGARQI
jgi:hypothetical protein